MYLYHSFPRMQRKDGSLRKNSSDSGLNILRSMISDGLLLFPEELDYKEKNEDLFLRKDHRRASFTVLNETELKNHCSTFGKFTIGIQQIDARLLGILPTIYIYKSLIDRDIQELDVVDGGLAQLLMVRLQEIFEVFSTIAFYETRGYGHEDDYYYSETALEKLGYFPTKENLKKIKRIKKYSQKKSRDLIEQLPDNRVPAQDTAGFIKILMSLIQYAESDTETNLNYYRQREWRMIDLHSKKLEFIPLDYEELPEEISANYSKMIESGSNFLMPMRNKKCTLLRKGYLDSETVRLTKSSALKTNWNPFFNFVSRVICPKSETESVKQLMVEHKEGFEESTDTKVVGFSVLDRVV